MAGTGRDKGRKDGAKSLKEAIAEQERRDRRDRFVAEFVSGCLARRYRLPSTEQAAEIFDATPELEKALADWGAGRPYDGRPAPEGIKGKVEDLASRLRAQLRARKGRNGRAEEA